MNPEIYDFISTTCLVIMALAILYLIIDHYNEQAMKHIRFRAYCKPGDRCYVIHNKEKHYATITHKYPTMVFVEWVDNSNPGLLPAWKQKRSVLLNDIYSPT